MDFISKIEHIVERVNFVAPEPASYNRGLSQKGVVRLLESNGVSPLPELLELYTWANGGHKIDGSYLIFLTLEEALAHFGEWHQDHGRPRTWFPLVTMNGDVYIYVDLETLALHSHDAEFGETRQLAEHYSVYLDALIEGLTIDGAVFDEDQIAISFAPGVWLDVMTRLSVKHPWL